MASIPGDQPWQPVAGGRSGATVHRRGGLYRKETPDAAREAAALTWLREQGFPAAEVVGAGPGWLVTKEVPGRSASEPWPRHRREQVVDAIAEITGALHGLWVEACPFDRTLEVTLAEARSAVNGTTTSLRDPHVPADAPGDSGPSPRRLLQQLQADAGVMRDREVPVVTHGDWCLPNVLLDAESVTVTGIIDAGRLGRADRCIDLALMSRSLRSALNPQFGEAYAERFLQRLGFDDADAAELAFYRLLTDLS